MATPTSNCSGQKAWSHLWLHFFSHATFNSAANSIGSIFKIHPRIWLLMIATHRLLCSNPPSSPAQITEASLTGLPFLLLPCSSFSHLLIQKPQWPYLNRSQILFPILMWLSRGLQGSSSWQPMANPQPHLLPHFLLLWTSHLAVSLPR